MPRSPFLTELLEGLRSKEVDPEKTVRARLRRDTKNKFKRSAQQAKKFKKRLVIKLDAPKPKKRKK